MIIVTEFLKMEDQRYRRHRNELTFIFDPEAIEPDSYKWQRYCSCDPDCIAPSGVPDTGVLADLDIPDEIFMRASEVRSRLVLSGLLPARPQL